MNSEFEWMRIALAMGLMVTAFIALPMFFLWKDRRADERVLAAKVAAEQADDQLQSTEPGL